MHVLRTSRWRRGEETERWFPEWADRIEHVGIPLESARNSYSAGGYAEEFGYRAQPGLPGPAAPLLAGDPEGRKVWRMQCGALHPGYPECARPLDRDLELSPIPGGAGARRGREMPLHHYMGEFRVIRLGRTQSFGSSTWERLLYFWKGLRLRARHLRGY